jgi:deoxyribonuclease V
MIACIDVGYEQDCARVACVTFEDWEDALPTREYLLNIDKVEPYVPGEFYRRELPCIQAILDQLDDRPDFVVIDGYVWLDAKQTKGLGGHLYEALGGTVPVIGVAKTPFATATCAVEVLRGSSSRPLYVTASGIDQRTAADHVRRMDGPDRIPKLLKRVDRLSRSREGDSSS